MTTMPVRATSSGRTRSYVSTRDTDDDDDDDEGDNQTSPIDRLQRTRHLFDDDNWFANYHCQRDHQVSREKREKESKSNTTLNPYGNDSDRTEMINIFSRSLVFFSRARNLFIRTRLSMFSGEKPRACARRERTKKGQAFSTHSFHASRQPNECPLVCKTC